MEIPIVDIKSNKISGVKEGTFEYYHELAHIEFNESNKGQNIQYLQQMSEFYGIISIVITFFYNQFKYVALILVLIMIGTFIYEEVYCNYRAKEMLDKK